MNQSYWKLTFINITNFVEKSASNKPTVESQTPNNISLCAENFEVGYTVYIQEIIHVRTVTFIVWVIRGAFEIQPKGLKQVLFDHYSSSSPQENNKEILKIKNLFYIM